MNRFRREEMAAANAGFSVPPTPLSWSVSRHLLFQRCRRAYFLHYYYAQGGWDPYADPLLQYTWTAKKSPAYHERLESCLEKIMRSSFDQLRNVPKPFRRRMLAVQFQSRVAQLEKEWIEKEGMSVSFDKKRAVADLRAALSDFLNSPTCTAAAEAQNITLFNKAFKPSFFLHETELWYDPGLIWREGTNLVSLRIHLRKPLPQFIRAESDMFALAAQTSIKSQSTLSVFRYPDAAGKWKEVQCAGDASAGEKRFLADLEEMRTLSSGEKVNMIDFPADQGEHCSDCRFSAVCSAIVEQFGEY